jgi:type IV pilus assembly protein PilB
MQRLDAVPIGFRDDGSLIVAMVDPRNLLATDDIAMLTNRNVVPVVVTRNDLDGLLTRGKRLGNLIDEEEPESVKQAQRDAALERAADDGPTVRLVRSIIAQAISQGASDVHFDPDDGALLVRYRVDGIMRDVKTIPARQAARVISRIKILSELDISERRASQDGRMSLTLDGRRIDIRVVTVPLVAGESAVLRVLDPGDTPRSLVDLGMDDCDRERVERALRRSHGAILATGPTGSGKSTTLYASVVVVSSPEKTVMTIEDPVEYRLARVKQIQVHERAGVTFVSGLRSIVRADPDIIMVGEMRDRESAHIAIEAALTGHLMLSSLHTNSAPAAIACGPHAGLPATAPTQSQAAWRWAHARHRHGPQHRRGRRATAPGRRAHRHGPPGLGLGLRHRRPDREARRLSRARRAGHARWHADRAGLAARARRRAVRLAG